MGKKKTIIIRIIFTVLTTLLALTMILPLLWMISTSFKIEGEVFEFPIRLIPRTLDHGAAVLMIEESTVWQPHVLRHHHNNYSDNRTIEAIRDQIHDGPCYLPFFRTVAILSCKS